MSKQSEQRDAVDEVHQARASVSRIFKTKFLSMEENSRFVKLQQYSPDQLKKMEKQKRVPYVLDYINNATNTYQGIQRDRRLDVFYYGVEQGDEVRTEVLNAVKDDAFRKNNFVYVESDVFSDGLIQKTGAIGYEWSKEKDKNGALKIFRIPPRQLMWDLNSEEFSKSDATWISRHRLYARLDLKNKYPQLSKKIDKMSVWGGDMEDMGLPQDYLNMIADEELGVVALIEFYKRTWENRFYIFNSKEEMYEDTYYNDRQSADEAITERVQKFEQQFSEISAQFTAQGLMPPPPPDPNIFSVELDKCPLILKREIAHNQLFSEEVLEEPFYPIDFYHPYWYDRDNWCPVDVLKDGQRYFNKMFSMIDHWIGTMSKGLLMYNKKAVTAEEAKSVNEKFSSTGGVVPVEDVDNYKLFESKGPAPQLFSMVQLAQSNLADNSGGKNFQGKKETASESGVAVRQRIEQGGLSGFVVYDNLRRFRISVGEKVAWYLTTYLTMSQTVRIEGEELVQETMEKMQDTGWFSRNKLRPGVGYLKINTTEHNTIEGLKTDVVVDEARWSVTKNQAILQEMSMAMQSNPNLAKTFPPEVVLEYLQLPFSVKESAKLRMKQLEERQMQIEQAQAMKPPAVSASLGDAEKLPPEAFAQFMAKYFGIQIDPSQIQNPEMMKAQLDIEKAKAEMTMKGVEHQMNLEAKSQEHQMNLTAKKREADIKEIGNVNNLIHNQVMGEMKLNHTRQQMKDQDENQD